MLKELYIKNIAVIEELRVNFEDGFNVLTGETGAGKSILIDSINMAIGNRTNKDLLRTGSDKAVVSACFSANDKVNTFLEENGIEPDDESIILLRQLSWDGKSSSKINGMSVTSNILKEAGKLLIDIHGQNDNYFLLSNKYHINYLDDYSKLFEEKEDYHKKYEAFLDMERKINQLKDKEAEKEKRIELIEFQLNEIKSASLKPFESDAIKERVCYLSNIEKISSYLKEAEDVLYSNDYNAYDLLKDASSSLSALKDFDKSLLDAYNRLEVALIEVGDIANELSSKLSKTDFDEKEYNFLMERQEVINNLKRKYQKDEEELLKYTETLENELSELLSFEDTYKKYLSSFESLKNDAELAAKTLHEKRVIFAEKLSLEIESHLSDLDMPKVKFSAKVSEKKEEDGSFCLSRYGFDEVEFLISTNPGEDLKPLSKIASGGELSRIMLALKTIFSDTDIAETLIFDEIDTGVSGRAAQKIAEKIDLLSKKKQVLSITHLAQIASMADYHYLIKKEIDSESAKTRLIQLDEEGKIEELSRIIGGAYITDLTKKNAKEMLFLAKKIKNS